MHVAVDLNWLLQLIVLALAAAFGFLYLVRNTASRFFVVDSNFSSSTAEFSLHRKNTGRMGAEVTGTAEVSDSCAVCGLLTKKHCSRCKMVKYCSESCQRSHWNSEHKTKCKDLQSFYEANHTKSKSGSGVRKSSLVGAGGSSKIMKQSNKILFPYEEFVKIFNWDKPGYTPCGLLNCGNSCFANAVLQCLGYTRPLVAYLLEKGHKIECQMDDWCFLCEFQTHLERANQSVTPFSPINILSRLPNIGGNLGYGKQEDAHEFMRFAIDTMQSVCLDEFGGEKNVHPSYQETTLIQHIFGGCLLSQVICTECNNVSNQFENMMDLTVEIHGDAGSLEECLDQFTAKEWLHGDNMYKCDGCNAYVMAWKRLAVQRAPNILTIALKRFQSGRFGKLNKRITFPDTLDLSPYMSGLEDGNDVYKLYAVIVHVDMLNASYFGHYICYVKDFCGNWYRIDDCKVATVDLDEVLSQGAYMLLYSRICARRSCFLSEELLKKQENENMKIRVVDPSLKQPTECLSAAGCLNSPVDSGDLTSANCSGAEVNHDENLLSTINAEDAKRGDADMVSWEASFPVFNVEPRDSEGLLVVPEEVASPMKCTNQPHPASTSFTDEGSMQAGGFNFEPFPISDVENESQGDKGDADEGLLMFENDDKCDISPITICKVQEEEPVYSTSMTENANRGGNGSVSPDDDTKGAAKKLNIESSGAKLKSVLAPGFLGNYPRKVLIKQEDKVLTDLREGSPQFHLNNKTNEVVRPYLLPENGCLLKDEKKPRSVLENGQVSMKSVGDTILENGYPLKDDKISSLVLENEQVSMKSFGHKILENGDTGHWTAL